MNFKYNSIFEIHWLQIKFSSINTRIMRIKNQIDKNSPINNDDFLYIIEHFETTGTTLDDRGRNKVKFFEVKNHEINTKSFKIPNLINKVAYKYIRKSKAQRSFEHAKFLIKNDIGTPIPYAYYEFSTPLGLNKSYYFSKQFAYDFSYHKLVNEPDYPDHENILRQFTRFTFKLHENGIYFKDHSPGNTLINKKGKDYEFSLIDLNRMDFITYDFDSRMKNFSRLTTKKEMVRVMSDEYAKLINEPFERVFEKMWFETEEFQKKQLKKRNFKKKYLGR